MRKLCLSTKFPDQEIRWIWHFTQCTGKKFETFKTDILGEVFSLVSHRRKVCSFIKKGVHQRCFTANFAKKFRMGIPFEHLWVPLAVPPENSKESVNFTEQLTNSILTLKRQLYEMVKHTQIIRRLLPTNCLSVFDRFVGLALKELRCRVPFRSQYKTYFWRWYHIMMTCRAISYLYF